MEPLESHRKPVNINFVSSTDLAEFCHLTSTLNHTSVIGLDAEWKPVGTHQPTFPTVTLLQIACLLNADEAGVVFLVDLSAIDLPSIYEILRGIFESPDILKLGFRFKQDLAYLSSTFQSQGGLFRELQCSDWSSRPLNEKQMAYAAMDAYCLIDIFNVFRLKVLDKGNLFHNVTALSNLDCNKILQINYCESLEMIRATTEEITSRESFINTNPMNGNLLQIIISYCDKIVLKESDTKPQTSKKKNKRKFKLISKRRQINDADDCQGLPPWDRSLGGDGCPKFLCDMMVEGLAKHLRCVGIDAATPSSRTPSSRDLIEQAYKEKRVLLTQHTKLTREDNLTSTQIYRVKKCRKDDQLLEVIQVFQLEINKNELMSRCPKCNAKFIRKPLSIEEAIEATQGLQVIPDFLLNKNLEFWQCMDCKQLYWESLQYHNAVQKFIDLCNLKAA